MPTSQRIRITAPPTRAGRVTMDSNRLLFFCIRDMVRGQSVFSCQWGPDAPPLAFDVVRVDGGQIVAGAKARAAFPGNPATDECTQHVIVRDTGHVTGGMQLQHHRLSVLVDPHPSSFQL
jgi:hypothetical protein